MVPIGRDASELGSSDLETVHKPLALDFQFERSAFPEDGLQLVASGTMNNLRELDDLEEGIYLLTLNTEPHTRPCLHSARWVTLLHWQAHKYAHCRILDHEAEWRTFSSQPVQVPRHEFGTLALAPLLTRFNGAGGRSGTIWNDRNDHPEGSPGRYKLIVTSTGCILRRFR